MMESETPEQVEGSTDKAEPEKKLSTTQDTIQELDPGLLEQMHSVMLDLEEEEEEEEEETEDHHKHHHHHKDKHHHGHHHHHHGHHEHEEEEEIEVEEEEEEEDKLQFFGEPTDEETKDSRIDRLREALKKRDFEAETAEFPSPTKLVKEVDLNIPFDRKVKLLKQFSTSILPKLDPPYKPVEQEVVTDYDVKLPIIGYARRLPKADLKKEFSEKFGIDNEGDVKNPFFVPENIPLYMKEQEEARIKERQYQASLPTKEKLHGRALVEKQIAERVKPYKTDHKLSDDTAIYNRIVWEAQHGLNITHIQKVAGKLHANYLTHRKNVFYSEYGIYARKKAMEKMRESEEAEEIALKNYEYLSNYTSESLDIFLKETEDASTHASRVAEEKLKENLILNNEARNLRLETSSMKNEITALNENLRECKYYMTFLDGVARELMRRDEEDRYRTERRQQQIKEDLVNFLKEGMTLKQAQKALKEKNKAFIGSQFRQKKQGGNTESAAFIQKLQEEARAQALKTPMTSKVNSILHMLSAVAQEQDGFDEAQLLEELDLVGGDEYGDREELSGLVFTKPAQLLDLYVELEEQNLSLIQHAQINEEVLEALERRIRDNRKGTENRSRQLRDLINEIETQMQKTSDQIDTLNLLIDMFTGGYFDVKSQEKMMKLLRKHVNKVYKTSIGSNEAHLSSVLMLTSIEKNFEDVVRDLESMPSEVVLKISRDLEKERHEAERVEQERERQKHRNERIAKGLERAKAPIKQKKGRTLAFRSRPPKLAVHLTQKDLDKKAEEDEWNYYFGE